MRKDALAKSFVLVVNILDIPISIMVLFYVENQFAVALALESSIIVYVNITILRSNNHKLLGDFCTLVKLEELRCTHTISRLNKMLLADYHLLRLCILGNFNY